VLALLIEGIDWRDRALLAEDNAPFAAKKLKFNPYKRPGWESHSQLEQRLSAW